MTVNHCELTVMTCNPLTLVCIIFPLSPFPCSSGWLRGSSAGDRKFCAQTASPCGISAWLVQPCHKFQLTFSLAGSHKDVVWLIPVFALQQRERKKEKTEEYLWPHLRWHWGSGARHCHHKSLCNSLTLACGFASLNAPGKLHWAMLKLRKQWKHFPSNKTSVKYFYKL